LDNRGWPHFCVQCVVDQRIPGPMDRTHHEHQSIKVPNHCVVPLFIHLLG
jgi:hypothetical protein